ncbi:MAG: rod shape-determining protein MreC [Alphaproteobacteria bacterium]|nr:rod shape-determining protein MreC [Alphaproteobacteria bacterium]
MREHPSRLRLLKGLYRQFGLYFYIFLAAILILVGVSKHPIISQVRIEVADFSVRVVNAIYKPLESLGYLSEYVSEYIGVHNENVRLKSENQKLLYWMRHSEQLSQENRLLKKQMNFISPDSPRYWSGYIVADNGGIFSRSVLVRLGSKDGIKRGFVALYNEGVLGRIEAVGSHTSQILLLTDYASRVPVLVGNKRFLAVVVGDNSSLLKLTALPEGAEVTIGDYVSTSGHSGVYPPGLAIGTVVRVDDEDDIWVKPFVSREDTPFVTIVDYGLDGLLDTHTCPECPVCKQASEEKIQSDGKQKRSDKK